KLVICIKIAGALDRTVRSNIKFYDVETFERSELENSFINTSILIILLIIFIYHLLQLLLQLVLFLFFFFSSLNLIFYCFYNSILLIYPAQRNQQDLQKIGSYLVKYFRFLLPTILYVSLHCFQHQANTFYLRYV